MQGDDDQPTTAGAYVVERLPGSKTHFCVACSFPVSVYGRLYPCLHAFCLSCASDMDVCFICQSPLVRLERWPKESGLYISPATLQSFKNSEDLIVHTKKVYQHLVAAVQKSEQQKAAAAKRERDDAGARAAPGAGEELRRHQEDLHRGMGQPGPSMAGSLGQLGMPPGMAAMAGLQMPPGMMGLPPMDAMMGAMGMGMMVPPPGMGPPPGMPMMPGLNFHQGS